jgi:macrolide-specific efflux system membrane fusion protein
MLKHLVLAAALLGVTLLATAQQQPQQNPNTASQLLVDECEVSLINDAKISAKEAGEITAVEVDEGDEVEVGDLLAQIDDAQAKSDKELAEADAEAAAIEANSDVEERIARMTVKVAQAEYDQVKKANDLARGAKSEAEVRIKLYTWRKSEVQVDEALMNRALAKAKAKAANVKVKAADINIDRRRVVAPINGTVEQVFLRTGEWANPGDPIVHVVRLDRLRVVGWVDAGSYGPTDIAARPVQLNVTLPGGRPATFQGKITFVDPVLAPGGKRFRVYAEVANRKENEMWLLQPNQRGTLAIDLTHRAEQREAAAKDDGGPSLSKVR